jgi:hypothetical protein
MTPFRPFAANVAWAAAIGGIAYGLFFVIIGNRGMAAGLLMVGGILTALILSGLVRSVEGANDASSRWAELIGTIGAVGSAIHGGYDLANVIHPPESNVLSLAEYPNSVDPRGLATFGLVGIAFLIVATLMARSDRYPRGLARVGQVLGVVMIVIYLGRLVILDPTNPVVRVALAAGVITNTVFLGWLGSVWRKR